MLHEQLKQLREKRGLTQNEVAERLFLTRQTISNWETGKTEPDLQSLGRLCELYGVPVCGVLGEGPGEESVCPPDPARRAQSRGRALRGAAVWAGIALLAALCALAVSMDYYRFRITFFGAALPLATDSFAGRLLLFGLALRPALLWTAATLCLCNLLTLRGRPRLPRRARVLCGALAAAVYVYALAACGFGVFGVGWPCWRLALFMLTRPYAVFAPAALALFAAGRGEP